MKLPEEIHELILAKLAGEIDSEEEARLHAWLEENERNQGAYQEFCSLWYAGKWGALRDSVNRDSGWEKVLRRRRYKYRNMWSRVAVAAVVVFVIGFVGWNWSKDEKVQVTEHISVWKNADIKLILSSGEEVNLKMVGKGEINDEGMVIRSDSAYLDYTGQTGIVMGYNELIVPKCGEYRLRLPDGSSVVLNAESKLRFPLNFTGEKREVFLDGEACFEIVKDSLRPFVVHTAKTDVRVLGTLFNVSAYPEEVRMEITLVNGAVQVNAADYQERLKPNQQFVLDNSTLQARVREVDARTYIAWTDGLFRFDAMPLEQLMSRLSRWFDVSYEFKDETLKKIRFTGGFRKYDDINDIMKMIGEITNVSFKMVDNKVVIDKK
ncbi:FecR family protein [Butyricimonas synergistica]|uniref:FecR family protein n=1 Tax=Butyricimonas synergistica TaxID=544644 RepID=UPI000375245C|nr:FecR family protein [Butyricimonas synergistica]